MESRVRDIEDQLPPLARETQAAHHLAKETNRLDNLENRICCNNVRIVGLPEKAEGRDPTTFVENWLIDQFDKDAFSPLFNVERARYTPGHPLPQGGPSRPLLARPLHYRDREVVLRQARDRDNIWYNGTRLSFYPYCSAKFAERKRRLRNLQLTYAMLYPAKLHVIAVGHGQVHFFESAKNATAWFTCNEQALRHKSENEEGDRSMLYIFILEQNAKFPVPIVFQLGDMIWLNGLRATIRVILAFNMHAD